MSTVVRDESRENEEVLDCYLHRHGEQEADEAAPSDDERADRAQDTQATAPPRRSRRPEYAEMEWDNIEPHLVAKIEASNMLKWAVGRKIRWATPLEQLEAKYQPPWRDPPTSAAQRTRVRVAAWLGVRRIEQLTKPPRDRRGAATRIAAFLESQSCQSEDFV